MINISSTINPEKGNVILTIDEHLFTQKPKQLVFWIVTTHCRTSTSAPEAIRHIPVAQVPPSIEDGVNLQDMALILEGQVQQEQIHIFHPCH